MDQSPAPNTSTNIVEEEKSFSISDFAQLCLGRWKWFAGSVLVLVALGWLYAKHQQPVYARSCSVLIKDQDGGGGVGDIANAFASMGLVSSNTSVNNELIALTSPAVMAEVVKRLHLTDNYKREGTWYWQTLYGTNQPFIVDFSAWGPKDTGSFRMDVNPGKGTMRLYRFRTTDTEGNEVKHDAELTIPLASLSMAAAPEGIASTPVKTPIGTIKIARNSIFTGTLDEEATFSVSHSSAQLAVEDYTARLKGDLTNKDADVIDLSIKDVSVQRANDILNTVILVYNQNWVEDKNRIAVATSNFIGDRLKVIEQDLGEVDKDIADYKTENLVIDLPSSSMLAMNQAAQQSDAILDVNNQLAMATYVKQYLADPANRWAVIPVNTGFGSPTLESQIATYNQLLLSRNNLIANSSASNPIVRDYESQLEGMREAIVRAVNTQVAALGSTLKNMRKSYGESESQLAAAPGQARHLLSVERQQKVKEALYLFLLQKREENQLSQTFTAYNTRIITPPYGPSAPVSPKTGFILAFMVLLGIACPAVLIYLKESSDTKVRSRSEVDSLPVPFAGEVPQHGGRNPLAKMLKTKKQKQAAIDKPLVVVEAGNRNSINEAFRLLRSNLNMMSSAHEGGKEAVMFTSFTPGSGKSFIVYNLGVTFAVKGLRTLIIDGDLRHGSLSMYVGSPSKGLAPYLSGKAADWRSQAVNVPGYPSLDILPVGKRPPNPSELLDSERMKRLIEEAKKEYDQVLIDCPPTDIVVDAQLIGRYVERTVFVLRAGLTDKRALPLLGKFVQEKKYKAVTVVLNGVVHGTTGNYYATGDYYAE